MTINTLQFYLFILTPILFVIGFWCYYDFKSFKEKENSELNTLYCDLEAEKQLKERLKKTPDEIYNIEKNIHQKILKIKIDIFNLNFSIKEVFLFLNF